MSMASLQTNTKDIKQSGPPSSYDYNQVLNVLSLRLNLCVVQGSLPHRVKSSKTANPDGENHQDDHYHYHYNHYYYDYLFITINTIIITILFIYIIIIIIIMARTTRMTINSQPEGTHQLKQRQTMKCIFDDVLINQGRSQTSNQRNLN